MKRLVPAVLALASAHAISNDFSLEHVLVSVPLHKKVAKTALPVTVLSGDELRRQASATIGDTLSNSPGLASASFGPGVGQPVVRGQAGPRVKVLQNGTSSADASNVSADHATSVEPLLADSIEVLRGPATLLYGGGAIGGVINVLDNRIPTQRLEQLQGGIEYRHQGASSSDNVVGRLEGGNGAFAFHLDGLQRTWGDLDIPGYAIVPDSGSLEDSDGAEDERGTIENTDGETSAYTVGASYHTDDGFFGFSINQLDNLYGIPPGSHAHEESEEHGADDEVHSDEEEEEENIRIDVEQTRYDAALHLHNPVAGIDVFRGFFTYTDYQHIELEGDEIGTRYNNETWETRLEVVHNPVGNFHGSFGLQASGGEFSAVGDEAFIPVTESSEIGFYVVEDYHYERVTLEAGLRVDRIEHDPDSSRAEKTDYTAYSAAGSLLFELSDSWQLGVALMRAERAPATEELFSNVESDNPADWLVHAASRSIEVGDPNLQKEISSNLDISFSWAIDEHFVTLNGFYNDFSDYIALSGTGMLIDETQVYQYANEDARFYGVELDSEFAIGTVFKGDLRLALTGDYISGELDNGADVPRLPPMRLGSKLSWKSDQWYWFASVLAADDQDRPGDNESETNSYTRWDTGVEYRQAFGGNSTLVLFANLNNISDEEIRLSTSFLRDFAPEAGRSLAGGFRIEF
jgi:iron complex outermembrane receptor protein